MSSRLRFGTGNIGSSRSCEVARLEASGSGTGCGLGAGTNSCAATGSLCVSNTDTLMQVGSGGLAGIVAWGLSSSISVGEQGGSSKPGAHKVKNSFCACGMHALQSPPRSKPRTHCDHEAQLRLNTYNGRPHADGHAAPQFDGSKMFATPHGEGHQGCTRRSDGAST